MYGLAHSEKFGRPPPRAVEPQRAGDVDVFPWTGNGGGVLKSASAPADLNQVACFANGQGSYWFWLRCRRWGSGRRKRSWRRQSSADSHRVSAGIAVGSGDGNDNGIVSFGQADLMPCRVGGGIVGGNRNAGGWLVGGCGHGGRGSGMAHGSGVLIAIASEVDGNATQCQRAQRGIARKRRRRRFWRTYFGCIDGNERNADVADKFKPSAYDSV